MDLKTYLTTVNEPASNWASRHKIDPATLSRFLAGKQGLKLDTARKIVEASGGQVSYEDLIGVESHAS